MCIFTETANCFNIQGSERTGRGKHFLVAALHCVLRLTVFPETASHLTQGRPLFSLADTEGAITAHTITTPRSAQ